MSLALLFPGQGTQHPEMLRWLDREAAAAPILSMLADRIGSDWRAHLADTDWAADNRVAQALITGLGLAAWHCLAGELPAPAAVAGYSVGELAAFSAAGVFDASVALDLAGDRAEAMQASVAGRATGMLAVQGLATVRIDAIGAHHGLSPAIRLAADSQILGGLLESLDAAQPAFEAAGGRCTRLAIHIASHTPWMAGAAEAFARRLAGVPFAVPRTALVCNLSGRALRQPEALRQALAAQIAHPVPWDGCMDAVAERRVRCVLEMGPGHPLTRLWQARVPQVPARSIDEFRSAAAVLDWVRSTLGA